MKARNHFKKSIIATLCAFMLIFGAAFLGVSVYAADGEAPATHTAHKLCGDAACADSAHDVSGEWVTLNLGSFLNADETSYEITEGNYYLADNVTAEKAISIDENVNLCLNGKTLTLAAGKNILISGGTASVCDCSVEKTGNMDNCLMTLSGDGAEFNLYSGTLTGQYSIVNIEAGATANVYGGLLKTTRENSNTQCVIAREGSFLNIYGGHIKANRMGIYAQNGSTVNIYGGIIESIDVYSVTGYGLYVLAADVNIYGGTFRSADGIGIHAQTGARLNIAPENNSDLVVSGAEYGLSVQNVDSLATVSGGTYSGASGNAIFARGITVITGAPIIQGEVMIGSTVRDTESGKYYLDVSGYTGEDKISITKTALTNGMVLLKGSIDKVQYIKNTNWLLSDDVDEDGNAVVKINCAGHKSAEDPTCISAKSCSVCRDSYTLEHTFGEWQNEIPATCMEDGTKGYKLCSDCGLKYDTEGNAIDDLSIPRDVNAHTWDDGEITAAPTCSATGTRSFTCTHNAEHTKTEEIAVDETAHSFGQCTQTTAPTCTSVGKESRVCAHSSAHTEERDVPMLGHDFSVAENDENEHWKKCSRCDATAEKEAHSYEDGACVCGKEKTGLSGGAIAGIVVGSTVVAGAGGFSLFWFVIKKKSWAELLGIFKK